jgi:hypothetical protein
MFYPKVSMRMLNPLFMFELVGEHMSNIIVHLNNVVIEC